MGRGVKPLECDTIQFSYLRCILEARQVYLVEVGVQISHHKRELAMIGLHEPH